MIRRAFGSHHLSLSAGPANTGQAWRGYKRVAEHPVDEFVGGVCNCAHEMSRYTTFKYCLDPTAEQQCALARHAGAARFAYNQCLRMVKDALDLRRTGRAADVPFTAIDLINAFNKWKKSEAAGRRFAVDQRGVAEIGATGLPWRDQVCQQVFEGGAVDCARALDAWQDSRKGSGRRVGFPKFKQKAITTPSFRLRNKQAKKENPLINVGGGHARSVTLPRLGTIRVHDDTRPLRRMLSNGRAKILFVTISHSAGRWWVALNVEAADLHPAARHPSRSDDDRAGWIGVDRGLSTFAVAATADGREVARFDRPPKPLANARRRQRRLAKSLSRKKKGSNNRRDARARLARHHNHVRNVRRHFLHSVSNELVKTHDRFVLEDLNVAGMVKNRRLAKAISDAGWSEFARQLIYKARWRGAALIKADRWYPSSQLCWRCGARRDDLQLRDRVFSCECGQNVDRDLNAAVNLARWGETQTSTTQPRTPKRGGRVINARRRDGSGQHLRCADETSSNDAGTDVHSAKSA
jgi:putative transposase